MLQSVAECCRVLQSVAGVLQSVAVQCVAVCGNVLQRVAACGSVLQCAAVCHSELQCVVYHTIMHYSQLTCPLVCVNDSFICVT